MDRLVKRMKASVDDAYACFEHLVSFVSIRKILAEEARAKAVM